MRTLLFGDITQRRLVVSYRRFGTTYQSIWPLNMGPVGCLEASVTNYQSMMRNIPEERRSHQWTASRPTVLPWGKCPRYSDMSLDGPQNLYVSGYEKKWPSRGIEPRFGVTTGRKKKPKYSEKALLQCYSESNSDSWLPSTTSSDSMCYVTTVEISLGNVIWYTSWWALKPLRRMKPLTLLRKSQSSRK
jgi:hypothetical protein